MQQLQYFYSQDYSKVCWVEEPMVVNDLHFIMFFFDLASVFSSLNQCFICNVVSLIKQFIIKAIWENKYTWYDHSKLTDYETLNKSVSEVTDQRFFHFLFTFKHFTTLFNSLRHFLTTFDHLKKYGYFGIFQQPCLALMVVQG